MPAFVVTRKAVIVLSVFAGLQWIVFAVLTFLSGFAFALVPTAFGRNAGRSGPAVEILTALTSQNVPTPS